METVITIVPVGLGIIGLAFIVLLIILSISPIADETAAEILMKRAAAKRASQKAYERSYERSRNQSVVMLGGDIHQDAILASLCSPELGEGHVDVDSVTQTRTRAALTRGGKP